MNEEPAENLPSPSFEERVLAQLAAINTELAAIRGDINRSDARLSTLEEKVDRLEERFDRLEGRLDRLEDKVGRRLQETRPIRESVREQQRKLDTKFDLLIRDPYEVRHYHVLLARRVGRLESARTEQTARPPQPPAATPS